MHKHSTSTSNVKQDSLKLSFITTSFNSSPRLIISVEHLVASEKTVDQLYEIGKVSLLECLKSTVFIGVAIKDSGACFSVGVDFDTPDPDISISIFDAARFLAKFDEYLMKLIALTKRLLIGTSYKEITA